MKGEPENAEWLASGAPGTPGMPVLAGRATFQAELGALRLREKAHTSEGDAIAAAPTAADGGGEPRRAARFPGQPGSTSSDKRQQVPVSSRPDLEETAECGK